MAGKRKSLIRPPLTVMTNKEPFQQPKDGESSIPKPSNIPRSQTTPTKGTSYMTPYGYRSPNSHSTEERSKVGRSSRTSEAFDGPPSATLVLHNMNVTASYISRNLNSLREEAARKEAEEKELKDNILALKMQIQELELSDSDLQDKYNELTRSFKIKTNELDSLIQEKDSLHEEMKRDYELKVKKMNVDLESSRYQIEKTYMTEIENTIQEKFHALEKEKRLLEDEVVNMNKEIENGAQMLQDNVNLLKENFEKEKVRIKSHMEDSRRSLGKELKELDQQNHVLRDQIQGLKKTLEEKNSEKENEVQLLQKQKTSNAARSDSVQQLKDRISELKSSLKDKTSQIRTISEDMQQKKEQSILMEQQLVLEEEVRRKLHNRMQELKGNIRVFCRIRPPTESEAEDLVEIKVPNNDEEEQEIDLRDPRPVSANPFNNLSNSNNVKKNLSFQFDRVFQMDSQNSEIFEEISQLVQTALDGLNVCVFAYGQTGSGKTYTMSNKDGMIPRAVDQIFEASAKLKERGWTHKIYGEFLEIYNENINDLLGDPKKIDKIKYEIRHDTVNQKTSVTDLTTVELTSPEMMNETLERALKNRSIAATNANERSSRSHSVYVIRIYGENHERHEKVEGTLNLIDLAGSERLSHSLVTGDRLKETQSINKSLSCLADVIYALGDTETRKHIPFRNSKLTYLLQYSLSGDSKTLMFVNISPFAKHFNETVNSLRFAAKVNSTRIGK